MNGIWCSPAGADSSRALLCTNGGGFAVGFNDRAVLDERASGDPRGGRLGNAAQPVLV